MTTRKSSTTNHPLEPLGVRPKKNKTTERKARTTRKYTSKKKAKSEGWKQIKWVFIIGTLLGVGIWFGVTFKDGIYYYFSSKRNNSDEKSFFDFRTAEVLKRHNDMLVGFDVSQYQGVIDWSAIDSVAFTAPLEFVFIRATMGEDALDKAFDINWKGARANHFIRGAYHYYRPNENSTEQANNFIAKVKLSEGDLPPVLDIEEMPKTQTMENLRKGLKNWMSIVENHYGVKPILYSGENYYVNHLKEWFPDHTIWIANYNFFVEEIKPDWHFWQFSEKGVVEGIDGKVDLNIFQGNRNDMRKLLVR
ncbi:MAG: glycoside hydrolase family 25 protein [Flavobacteriaceae bacterium]|jgi:lysozyme|nr:glycoside hydrolase family 25 protein [Flavobacteriaceae bacterium]